MDESAFITKYGFNNFKIVTVSNPTAEDHEFQITMEVGVDPVTGKLKTEARKYIVKAGGHERFPGVVAQKYLDEMAKKLSQEEDQFKLYVDYGTRSKYYDRLIEDVEDLVSGPVNFEHLKPQGEPEASEAAENEPEVAFAGLDETAETKSRGRAAKN
jgi:hypothetical protein